MSLENLLEKIRAAPTPLNEEAAKFQVIAPLLECLGWTPTDGSEFLLEHSVGGKKGGRVDIALRATTRRDSRVVALVEAKAPGSNLEQHVAQMLGYAFHDGTDLCVLTTGLEWWLFLPKETGTPLQRRFAALKILEDPVDVLAENLRGFLSKKALTNGSAQKLATETLKTTVDAARLKAGIPDVWARMLATSDDDLVSLITAKVREDLGLEAHKEQVIAALNGKPVPTVNHRLTPTPPPAKPVKPAVASSSSPAQKPVRRTANRRTVKPVAVTFCGVSGTRFLRIRRL